MLIVLLWLFRRKSRPTLCDPMAAHQASLSIVSSLGSHHWTILSSWGADRLVWVFVNLVKDTPFDFPEYKLLQYLSSLWQLMLLSLKSLS